MTQPIAFQVVDVHDSGTELTVRWRGAPGAHAHPVEATVVERITQQVAALAEAAHHAGRRRDIVPGVVKPSAPDLGPAQRALGETLYAMLDGPERALARRLGDARRAGATLHLVVRLRAADRKAQSRHRALGWHLSLLAAPDEGPLALAPDVTIAVQLGDAEVTPRETVAGGRLQVLFMAFSPRDVEPVLDHEAEEERILTELAPFVEGRRLVVSVAEDGSLDELKRRLMARVYDIVHLTGHGAVTEHGPRLVMEDTDGDRDDVSAEQVLKVLRAGKRMPRLVVISACHSAEQRTDLPSLAAELIQGGVPCVVGWTRPVLDHVATDAAEELYRRLCSGEVATEAVASARRELERQDHSRAVPAHAWATLELLATWVPGFALDPDEEPAREAATPPGSLYRMLGSRMRVLAEGFVGRRRELQVLGKVLRRGRWAPPGAGEHAVAGALVVGMKGQGKSCLVARALDRHRQDVAELSVVVLHGELDDLQLLEAFRTEAVRRGDEAAERMLDDASRDTPRRIERLLRHHWRDRPLVIVLDDFEQNLDIPGEGMAQLRPYAAALLDVLLPACRDEQPKLLVTSTAKFALAAPLVATLAEVRLGALDGASVRKLWMRGQGAELAGVAPAEWGALCERLGRNARIVDWARQLLAGKSPDELRDVLARMGAALPMWKDQAIDDDQVDDLAAAFLRHMALDEAVAKVGPDAMAFIDRARVYEVPVPVEAFRGLTVGLAIDLERHVPALANLGLLEIGGDSGRAAYRVSPLVKPRFDVPEAERWHGVAAEHWWNAARQGDAWNSADVMLAWEHALQGRRQDIADEAADLLSPWMIGRGAYERSAALGERHVAVFPDSVAGLDWAGYARYLAGDPRTARRMVERAVELANSAAHSASRRSEVMASLAHILASMGEHAAASQRFADLIAAEEALHPEGSARLASYLHSHAGVLRAQGDLAEARALLERALAIKEKVYGREVHPDVAASLHELAGVLRRQGDLAGSGALLERALAIEEKVHGRVDHPAVAALLHSLAGVLRAQGDLAGARALLERALAIKEKVHGRVDHPDVAASLHSLAAVLRVQGDLAGARALLERALAIDEKVYGKEDHPDVAASLHELARMLHAQGDLAEARALLERSLAIREKLYGREDHPDVATSLHELARVLCAQGDPAGGRALLERSLAIDRKVHGREDHPDVATSYDMLGNCLRDLGLLDDSERAFRTALGIRERVFGNRDHYMYAETEFTLARLLLQRERPDEARELVHHAVTVLQAQVPNHPILDMLRSSACRAAGASE